MSKLELEQRAYQLEGIEFMRRKKRVMNTDRPGMGKTPQAALAAEGPTLVICPNYLVGQWGEWLETYMEGTVATCTGDRFKKANLIAKKADWTVCNTEMLRTHFQELMANVDHYQTLILDESHHLRNRNAIRSQHAAKLAKDIERVYLLSATPIWKEVDDLWMQLHIIAPEIFTSYHGFVDTFCIADSGRFGTKVLGVKKSMLPVLDELLGIVRIGRTYEQVGRQLPPKIEKVIRVEMPEKVQKLYKDAENFWIEEIEEGMTNFSQVLNALRQITSGPHKIEALKELVEDTGPSVIFTWYRDTAFEVGKALGCPVVTGELTVDERRKLALNAPEHVVATISSLSEGIDLSHKRSVIFVEEHWPPGANDQAMSRVHRERQGEDNIDPVVVHFLVSKNTIDEHIHSVSTRRQGNIRDVLEAGGLLRG